MREIKFRGLSRLTGKKYENIMVYGQLDMKPNRDARIVWYSEKIKGNKGRRSAAVDYRFVEQFTGILDAHNNELYEGDICWNAHSEYFGQVIWDEGAWCYQWDNIIEKLYDCADTIELRGNINETPELLGV